MFNEKAYQSFLSGTRIYDPPNSLFSDRWVGQADMPLLSLWGYDKYQKIGNAHGGCLSQSAANRKCYGVKYGNVFSLPSFEISDSGDGQWLVRVSGPLTFTPPMKRAAALSRP
ncbi:MAG: hypothetical protein R2861_00260 [Desulfobacterales bacterium]